MESTNLLHLRRDDTVESPSEAEDSELEQKADAVEWNRSNRHLWYVLFSISGFTDDLLQLPAQRNDVLLVDDSQNEG